MYRQGLAELREAFNPARDSLAQPTEYGIAGTALPSEIAQERNPALKDRRADKQPEGTSVLDKYSPMPVERVAEAERHRDNDLERD